MSGHHHALETSDAPPSVRISRAMAALWKEFYGRGPTHVNTQVMPGVVLVIMRGGFHRVEQVLTAEGRSEAVNQQRAAFQDVMSERFRSVIEEATSRRVEAFMSANHNDPEMVAEIFVLEGEEHHGETAQARDALG